MLGEVHGRRGRGGFFGICNIQTMNRSQYYLAERSVKFDENGRVLGGLLSYRQRGGRRPKPRISWMQKCLLCRAHIMLCKSKKNALDLCSLLELILSTGLSQKDISVLTAFSESSISRYLSIRDLTLEEKKSIASGRGAMPLVQTQNRTTKNPSGRNRSKKSLGVLQAKVFLFIKSKGGVVRARDVVAGCREVRTSDQANRCLRRLEKNGLGQFEAVDPGINGGRPTRQFVLNKSIGQDIINGSVSQNGSGSISKAVRFNVLRRDGFRCVYCGNKASDQSPLQIDHVKPRSKGGSNEPENLVAACRACNIGKSDRHSDLSLGEINGR